MGKIIKCRLCGKELVFLFTNSGSSILADKNSLTQLEMQLVELDRRITFRFNDHVAHFTSCSYIKNHRRE